MAQPGWYPDPAGEPGRLRWWDGAAWTDRLNPGGPSQPPGRRRGPLLLVALLLALCLVAVAAWFLRGGHGATSPVATASPTVSGWDERSSSSPAPSASPSAGGSASASSSTVQTVACPTHDRGDDQGPQGGRLTVSGTTATASVPAATGFGTSPVRRPAEGPWATSADSAYKHFTGTTWYSFQQLAVADTAELTTPKIAAHAAIECHLTSRMFGGEPPTVTVLHDEAVTVDGHRGWRMQVEAPNARAPGGGARYDAVAVEAGSDQLVVLWSGVVLADTDALTAVESARTGLHVQG